MKLTELRCPNCNSPIDFDSESKEVVCEFCGTKFAVEDETQRFELDNAVKKNETLKDTETPDSKSRSNRSNKTDTRTLVECALLIAIATVLELTSKLIGLELPFGGTITIASMLPIILISYRHGLSWGFLSGFAYSIIQMILGIKVVSAMFLPGEDQMILWQAICVCILDYIVAYTVLGIGGIFRGKTNPTVAILLGIILALGLRYIVHVVSGAIFYGAWAEWFFTQEGFYSIGSKILETFSGKRLAIVYSFFYNGLYMIPEIIITSIVGVIISRFPVITGEKRLFNS